jgi:hypothetical protein
MSDPELDALDTVARCLAPLAPAERRRILDWCERKWMTPAALLAEAAKIPPLERFRAMVACGLIDEEGRYLGRMEAAGEEPKR